MTDYNEKELLKGLANSDKTVIELIYKNCFKLIQTLILNNNGTNDDAKDIFQEALLVLYEKAKTEHFELSCQIKTYLYSVSKRLWLKKLQTGSRYVSQLYGNEEVADISEDIDYYQQKNEEFELMHKAIHQLGEPCKSLLHAFYMQKMNMQDIAEAFGYTNAENAKTQKYKCLVRLKKLFFSSYTGK